MEKRCQESEKSQTSRKKAKYSFNQYYRFRSLGKKRSIHRNGKFSSIDSNDFYYIDNTCGHYDLWKQKLPGSNPIQLTLAQEWFISNFVIAKNSKSIFLNAHYQGNEKMQIFSLPAIGGEPKRISKSLDKRYLLSENCQLDDTHLIISSNQLDSNHDVAILDIETGELEYLSATDSNLEVNAISPDGNYLIISEFVRHSKSNLYLMSLKSREIELITPSQNDGHNFFASWSADSKGFYFISNTDREFMAANFFHLVNKSFEPRITPKWDIEKVCASLDGKWLTWTVNENGYDVLYLKDLKNNSDNPIVLRSGGKIDIQEFSADSQYLAFTYGDSTKVADIHILNLKTGKDYRITNNMFGGIDPPDMIKPDLVKLKGITDLEFYGFLYKPLVDEKQMVPMILLIHGGPDSQERPCYDSLKQNLLSLGIGVLAPNIRGSTGYGQTFQKMIHRKFGDIKGDIEGCVNYLRSLKWVDANRIGIMGGSFGGYATLFAITKLAHQNWKVAVDMCGPSNLISFTTNVPKHWRSFMKAWVGDPIEDKEMLEEISPINFVNKIKCENILIAQGANDPRIPRIESDQIVEKLMDMGKNVEYIVYMDEGHGLEKKSNYQNFNKKAVEFIYKSFFNTEIDLLEEAF